MADINQWIAEDELAKALNVERAVLRRARKKIPRESVLVEARVVFWLRSEATAFAVASGMPFEEKTAPLAALEVETLTVVRPFGGKQLIEARRANGQLVIVRVGSSKNYVPRLRDGKPMTLQATKSSAGNWWIRHGRDPRYPGAY